MSLMSVWAGMAVVWKPINAHQLRLNKLRTLVLYLVLIQFCTILLCKSVSFPGLITKK